MITLAMCPFVFPVPIFNPHRQVSIYQGVLPTYNVLLTMFLCVLNAVNGLT